MQFMNCESFRNRSKAELPRNPQHCYLSLIFFAVLNSTDKYFKNCIAQYGSKKRQFCGIRNKIYEIRNEIDGIRKKKLRNPEQLVEIIRKYKISVP